jgi:hypothetical protein
MEGQTLLKDRQRSPTDTNRGICWFVFYAFLPTKAVAEGKMNVEYVQVTMSLLQREKYSRNSGSKSHNIKISRRGRLTPFGVNKENF